MVRTRLLADRMSGEQNTAPGHSGIGTSTRHLAAILAADVAGYSRLMGVDEEGTLGRLKAHRRQLVDAKIQEHHGRIVKTTGDGMLVEFPSVVDAVRCAVEIQRAMADRNTDTPEDQRISFRIGINLGDVIADGDDIYGDGVNIAARLEALAEPGGICISRVVWDQIRDKLRYAFEDLGEQNVKNIARPVSAYALGADAVASTSLVAARPQVQPGATRRDTSRPLVIAASVFAAIGIAAGAWWAWPQPNLPKNSVNAPMAAERQSSTAPAADATKFQTASTARLSIVVLPFANLSKDPEQEYFADAVTEDLTTDLSRISDSFVIARNTAFTYKGKAVDVKQIGRELGVRYVLEGSVRRIGEQAQVNVQLIDSETGAHLWADRFDTDIRNLAVAQNEITGRLAQTLQIELVQDASRRIEEERAVDPNARDLIMRGWAWWNKSDSEADRHEALRAFERALEIDPRSIDARIGIGLVLAANIRSGFTSPSSVQQVKERAEQLLHEALARDANRSMAHAAMGLLRRAEDRMAEAQPEFETAIALDRNNAWAIGQLGTTLLLSGQPEPAIPYLEKALRISPHETLNYVALGKCHLFLGDMDEAMKLFRKGQATNPGNWIVQLKLAGALGLIGKFDEAKAAAAEMVRLNPNMNSVARIRAFILYRNPRFQAFHDKTIIQGLRNIGFPEELAAQ
jgi:adenylate cyclase